MFWRKKPKTDFTVTLGDAVHALLQDVETTLAKEMRNAIEGKPDTTTDELAKAIKPYLVKAFKPLPSALGKRVDELAAELRELVGEDEMRRRWRGWVPTFAGAKKDVKDELRQLVAHHLADIEDVAADSVMVEDEDGNDIADVGQVGETVRLMVADATKDLLASLGRGIKQLSDPTADPFEG